MQLKSSRPARTARLSAKRLMRKKSMMETFGVYILNKGKGDKITEINTNQR